MMICMVDLVSGHKIDSGIHKRVYEWLATSEMTTYVLQRGEKV